MKTLGISTFLGLLIALPVLFSLHLYVISTRGTELSKGEIGLIVALSIGLVNLLGFTIAHFRKKPD